MKRDLKADLDWIAVLEKVITQAIVEKERADRIEALARELVEALGNHALFSTERRTLVEWDECEKRLEEVYLRAKEVLGDE